MWVNNDFGKGGRDAIIKALEAQGIKVAADISTDPGQVDFSGAGAEGQAVQRRRAVRLHQRGRVGARAARAAKQGYDKPIVGETTLTGQKVIELAGDAANGAIAHVGLTADAPQPAIKAFDDKFQKEYKYKSDHNGMKGYSAVYVIKAITEKNGKFDSQGVRPRRCTARRSRSKDYPGVLLDVTFDDNGDLDRESFLVKVVNGKQVVTETLPPLGEVTPLPPSLRRSSGRPARGASRRTRRHSRRLAMGDLIQLLVSGTATGRDLRARGAGLHAAVAGGGRHQLRAGRVRDAAGVRDAVLHGRWARRCGSRSCSPARSSMLILGYGFKRVIVDPLIKHGVIPLVIATLGLSIAVKSMVRAGYSAEAHPFPSPFPDGQFALAGINVSYADVGTLVIAGADRLRPAERSSTRPSPAARCRRWRRTPKRRKVLGINVKRMVLYVFLINAVLAVVAALLVTPTYLAKFDMGDSIGQKAFFAAIIGGFNQTRGALLGGVLIGILENVVGFYVSPAYKEGVALVLFLGVILFRPEGLLGKSEERKV